MRRLPWKAIAAGTGIIAGALAIALAVPESARRRAIEGYLLAAAALALRSLARAASRAARRVPSAFDLAIQARGAESSPPAELIQLERDVVLGRASALEFHHRLRPLLHEAAAARLAATRGLDIDRDAAARDLLGVEAWDLLRPDRGPPEDRTARGPSIPALEDIVQRLEAI